MSFLRLKILLEVIYIMNLDVGWLILMKQDSSSCPTGELFKEHYFVIDFATV